MVHFSARSAKNLFEIATTKVLVSRIKCGEHMGFQKILITKFFATFLMKVFKMFKAKSISNCWPPTNLSFNFLASNFKLKNYFCYLLLHCMISSLIDYDNTKSMSFIQYTFFFQNNGTSLYGPLSRRFIHQGICSFCSNLQQQRWLRQIRFRGSGRGEVLAVFFISTWKFIWLILNLFTCLLLARPTTLC